MGILEGGASASTRARLDAFRRALSGLGFQEGTNLELVYRFAGGDAKQLPELAADLVRTRPDVIVAGPSQAIAAAKRATTSIPIVMTENEDPVAFGFVASLARPGNNVTGMTNMTADLVGKRLQLLKELVPHLRRVAVLRNPSNFANLVQWRETQSAARTLAIQVFPVDVRSPDDIDTSSKTLPHLPADAALVFADGMISSNTARVVQLFAAQRLPAVYSLDPFVAAGGLLFFGASSAAIWIGAANYVARILNGARPEDLPVQRPTTFELTVNLKTARSLGIVVPQSILLRADQIIR